MSAIQTETLWVIEANLDDLNAQLVEVFIQKALDAGALDAWAAPIVMKKGRPGLLLSALCREEMREALREIFFRQTTTLGVRSYAVERAFLPREWAKVETPFGEIRIKIGKIAGEIVNAHPEFEDCRAAAERHNVAVKQVIAITLALFWGALATKR